MLRKKTLAIILTTALLVALATPALAAPADRGADSPTTFVSSVVSWFSHLIGIFDAGEQPAGPALQEKFGSFVDPGGLEDSDPPTPNGGDNLSTSSESDPPDDEFGVVIQPGG